MSNQMDDLMLPEPAFRLKWKDGAYYVSKPSIGDTDVFTAEQMREYAKKAVEADRLKIAEALRQVGLTLVKSTGGYHVMTLGQITAGPAR